VTTPAAGVPERPALSIRDVIFGEDDKAAILIPVLLTGGSSTSFPSFFSCSLLEFGCSTTAGVAVAVAAGVVVVVGFTVSKDGATVSVPSSGFLSVTVLPPAATRGENAGIGK
jgi:hypothetical protein